MVGMCVLGGLSLFVVSASFGRLQWVFLGGIFYFLASTSHRFQRGKGIEFPEGNPYECTVKPGEQLETPTVMTADKTKQLGNSTDFKRQNDHVSDFPMSVHRGSGLFFSNVYNRIANYWISTL